MTKTKLPFIGLLITFLIFNSCSSDDNNDEPNNGLPNTIKLISKINSIGFHQQYGYDSDTLVYQNGKLTKALFYQCSGQIHQFEYGSNGKISEHYITNGGSFNYDLNIDISGIDNQYITKIIHTYNSQNQLTKTEEYKKNGTVGSNYEYDNEYNFDYDSQNRIYRIQYSDIYGDNFTEGVDGFDNNGNMILDTDGYTYEYDNNPNPMYILFNEFGLYFLESCSSLETNNLFLTPNNLTKSFDENGQEGCFKATYTYDSDGYPESAYFRNCGNGEFDTENFEY